MQSCHASIIGDEAIISGSGDRFLSMILVKLVTAVAMARRTFHPGSLPTSSRARTELTIYHIILYFYNNSLHTTSGSLLFLSQKWSTSTTFELQRDCYSRDIVWNITISESIANIANILGVCLFRVRDRPYFEPCGF